MEKIENSGTLDQFHKSYEIDVGLKNQNEFLEAAKKGSRPAFDKIVQLYHSSVYRLAFRFFNNPDDAMDATQEVFLKAFRSIQGFEGRSSLKTWLLKITANTCSSLLQEKVKKQKSVLQIIFGWFSNSSFPGPEDLIIDKENREEVQKIVREKISNLPEVYRMPLILKDIEGMSIEQIEEVLDLKEGTVKSRINRGRRLLQESLESFFRKRN
ncbi:MAG: sigma-70 family RNA polymerase sigma factor [Candidatus Riflebacteria bacterium]|nr:sigma-70 family RNA polymerase sigma factor [Candidatus Riflebacteria bacterium]